MSKFDDNGMMMSEDINDLVPDKYGLETTETPAEFTSGAKRSNSSGRGHFEDLSPLACKRIAVHFELGAAAHGEWNYMLGMPIKRSIQSCLRHINDYMTCRLLGVTPKEDNLAAGVFNLISAMHTEELIKLGKADPSLDDIPTLTILKRLAAARIAKGKNGPNSG